MLKQTLKHVEKFAVGFKENKVFSPLSWTNEEFPRPHPVLKNTQEWRAALTEVQDIKP